MRILNLSYILDENSPLYGSTPKTVIEQKSVIKDGSGARTYYIHVSNHASTHIDAPAHFIENGKKIGEYSESELVFRNPVIIKCKKEGADLIEENDIGRDIHESCECILFKTGFGTRRGEDEYRTHNPGISPSTIDHIRRNFRKVRCIGIDSISVSSFQQREKGRETHKKAMVNDEDFGEPLLLVEDMNLQNVSQNDKIEQIIIVPWMIGKVDSAPCSVLAFIREG